MKPARTTAQAARRRAASFLAALVVLGAALLWPWPRLDAAYGKAFARAGNALLAAVGGDAGLFGTRAVARFVFEPRPGESRNVVIGLLNRDRPGPSGLGRVRVSSRHLGYVPAATVVALVLATPVPWRRRLRSLAFALVLVHAFVLARVGIVLLGAFHGTNVYSAFYTRPPWRRLLYLLVEVAGAVPATAYVVPLVLWAAVTVRREDVERWLLPPGGSGPRPGIDGS